MPEREMNKKAKTIVWIVGVSLTVLMISLMSGCYAKDNNDPAFQYYDQGKNSSSLTDKDLDKFVSSVKKIDGQAISHYKMALYFQKNNRHKLTIEELKKAVQRDPSMAKAYNAMGVSYDKLRQYDRAIHCYQLALQINPDLDYVYNNLGYSYLLSNNPDAAIESFQKALGLNDKNRRYRHNLTLAYVMTDRYDLAIDQLKDVEGSPHAAETVAKLARRLGKKEFEKQIVSVLHKIALEKALAEKAKPIQGKSADISQKIDEQETGTGRAELVVIRHKIEKPASRLGSDMKTSEPGVQGDGQGKGGPVDTQTADGTDNANGPEVVASVTLDKEASNVLPADDRSKNAWVHKQIQVNWEDSGNTPQVQADATMTNSARNSQRLMGRAVADKKPISNTGSLQKQDMESDKRIDQQLHLSAVEIVSEPPSEIPMPVSGNLKISDNATSINNAEKKAAQRQLPKIMPKVVDVAEIFKYTEKKPEHPVSANPVGRLEVIGLDNHSAKTRKLSPVYAPATTIAGKPTGQGRGIIEITPLRKVKKIQLAAAPAKEIKREQLNRDSVEIEVANGNGVNGMARKVATILKENGFNVIKITNASSFDHVNTKIFYYNGHRGDVDRLIQEIACCQEKTNIIELKHLGNRIRIIIGKDLAKQDLLL